MRDYGNTNAAPYASAPTVGAAGDTYFNTTDKSLYLSDGTGWAKAGATGTAVASISLTAPGAPQIGQLWWRSDSGRLFIYYNDGTSSQWVPVNLG
jgi:hypothetical protein